MEHDHRCPKCGKKFEHDNDSNITCPGEGAEWLCSRCYEVHLWGPLSMPTPEEPGKL